MAGVDDATNVDAEKDEGSKTELDTHANMPVLGMNCYIIAEVGKTATVQPYRPDYEPMDIPLIHGAVKYECTYTGETYVLVIRNALYVPTMTHNLIPPFILREKGIRVNDVANIHVDNPTSSDHAIVFEDSNLKIPLALRGKFSYFDSSKPSRDTMLNCEEIYLLTPTHWNPHTSVYAENESNMVDWKGDVIEPKYRKQIILQDNEVDDDDDIGAIICEPQLKMVHHAISNSDILEQEETPRQYQNVPRECNEVASVLNQMSPVLNEDVLLRRMELRADIGIFGMEVGSTTNHTGETILYKE